MVANQTLVCCLLDSREFDDLFNAIGSESELTQVLIFAPRFPHSQFVQLLHFLQYCPHITRVLLSEVALSQILVSVIDTVLQQSPLLRLVLHCVISGSEHLADSAYRNSARLIHLDEISSLRGLANVRPAAVSFPLVQSFCGDLGDLHQLARSVETQTALHRAYERRANRWSTDQLALYAELERQLDQLIANELPSKLPSQDQLREESLSPDRSDNYLRLLALKDRTAVLKTAERDAQ